MSSKSQGESPAGSESGSPSKRPKPGPAARAKAIRERDEAIEAAIAAQISAAAALPPGDEDDLTAMRHVMNQPGDRTYQHWSYRQWLKEDPAEFRKKLASLARAREQSGRGTSGETNASSLATPTETGSTPSGSSLTDHVPPVLKELLAPEFEEIEEYHRHRAEFREWLASRTVSA